MNDRRSSVMVGAFVVSALVIAVASGLFFAGGGFGAQRSKMVMAFDGSLRGLTVGAPIALRGVTIGQVIDIDLLLDAEAGDVIMVVIGEIDPGSMQLIGRERTSIRDELVDRGLRARLELQSLLTGLLYIQLDFYPDKPGALEDLDYPHPQIPTIPTELEELRRSLASMDVGAIADDVHRIARGLDALVNNPDMQSLPAAMHESLVSVEAASESLDELLHTSTPRLNRLLDESSETLVHINEELPRISASLNRSLASLDEVLSSADATLDRIETAAAPGSPVRRQFSQAMHELSLAARSLRSLARSLDEHPEALLRGRRESDP